MNVLISNMDFTAETYSSRKEISACVLKDCLKVDCGPGIFWLIDFRRLFNTKAILVKEQ